MFSSELCHGIDNETFIAESIAHTDYSEELKTLKAEQDKIEIAEGKAVFKYNQNQTMLWW